PAGPRSASALRSTRGTETRISVPCQPWGSPGTAHLLHVHEPPSGYTRPGPGHAGVSFAGRENPSTTPAAPASVTSPASSPRAAGRARDMAKLTGIGPADQ